MSTSNSPNSSKDTPAADFNRDKPVSDNHLRLARQYLEWETIPEHRKCIETLIIENNNQRLEELLGSRLTFGTAGIRGPMGAGFSRMNDLVIIQTAQGLASYLIELNAKAIKEQGVIIGNDARYNSARFARLTALAFLQKSIPVYFCDHIVPTPLVAFGVLHYSCFAGIMITASHNPKNDNGFKVYFQNGAQILSPHDKYIQEHIIKLENLKPWPKSWQHELLLLPPSDPQHEIQLHALTSLNPNDKSLKTTSQQTVELSDEWKEIVYRIYGDLTRNYLAYIEDSIAGDKKAINRSAGLSITFTALHGVGHMFLSRALEISGFHDISPVESQKNPDPEFSSVKFPNPEEQGALDLAFLTAKHANSKLILANDPDADRLGAAIFDPETGYKRILTGNEIGSLLGWWLWHNHREKLANAQANTKNTTKVDKKTDSNKDDLLKDEDEVITLAENCYFVASAVSSNFLKSMSDAEGFKFVQTLTGFKNMCNFADSLYKESNGTKKVLFAFEEALGYMVDTTVMDKDGISAAIQLSQCAAYCYIMFKRSLEQQLDYLYEKYGYHYSINSYYICNKPEIIKQIFSNLQKNYPKSFKISTSNPWLESNKTNEFKVLRIRDLNNGYDSGEKDGKAKLPTSSSSYMLTLYIEQDITITFRTSGTEPKIKYYSEIRAKTDRSVAQNKLQNVLRVATTTCLEPEKYKLIPEYK